MITKTAQRLGILNTQFSHGIQGQSLLRQSVRAFASGGQYDVCVIGGGPGGKLFRSYNFF
jgi:hypothetical protein